MVEDSVKYIYNNYLRITRGKQGKPYKQRQDFSDFDDEKYIACKKIESFFKNHPHVNKDIFFEAPFKTLPDFFPQLAFYTSAKAIKCYTMYIHQLNDLPPDSEYHLQQIKNGLKFITTFCIDNKITFQDYVNQKTEYLPHWLIHLKCGNISFYNLMFFQDFKSYLESVEKDILSLYIPDFFNKYFTYKMAYLKSKKAKKLVENGSVLCDNKTRTA